MVEKSAEYTALPALLNYLVLAQEEPRVWVWSRFTHGWSGPEMTEGTDGVVELGLLQISIPLQVLYADLLPG
jgi:hypothetical protein